MAGRVSNRETEQVVARLKNGMASIQAEGLGSFIMIGCLFFGGGGIVSMFGIKQQQNGDDVLFSQSRQTGATF